MFNPAFDVTDHTLIAGIVTEKGTAEHLTKKAWLHFLERKRRMTDEYPFL